jgi:hypothetical protein
VGLERGPLSLVSTIEELLGRKSSGLEGRDRSLITELSWFLLGATEKNHENLIEDSRCPVLASPEYKPTALPLHYWRC